MGGAERVPLVLVISFVFSLKCCAAIDNITASQELSQGQTLISPSKIFELGFFSPNNSGNHKYVGLWYKGIFPQTVVWVANRESPLAVTDARASLRIGNDGNMELVDGNQSFVWSTNVRVPSNSSVATLSDNGNFVLQDGMSGEKLWQSFEHPGDTFLPGSLMGVNVKTGQKYEIISWKSESDPSHGNFTSGISSRLRPAQAFIWNGSTPHWRSGPWGKLKFIGMPEVDSSYQKSSFTLVEDEEKGTVFVSYESFNSTILSREFLSSDGVLRILRKNDNGWSVIWMSPKNPCDVYGACGPSGICDASGSPICKCLKGFVPKSNEEWSKGNWSQGCTRQTELLCEKNTSSPTSQGGKKDGFLKFSNMKLPDFYEYVYAPNNIDSCQTWCLDNCSCRACAYVYGIGCLIWSEGLVDIQEFAVGGEDIFLRLAHEELDGGQKNTKIIIILTTVSSVFVLSALLWTCLHRRRAKQKTKATNSDMYPMRCLFTYIAEGGGGLGGHGHP
ncbi:hypothetical protein TIFTF001_020119 [Ficus carica]|uniref:Uncharacterized protein n=1 Tax=Ficus carica TaxID=3494 RepID=A0AA88AET3_FICCA|nr:hypothetical protein TIFTF001_020119 [Ficus carica]